MKQTRYLLNSVSINYPVYRLEDKPIEIDKVVFVNGYPIDDKSINKPTLGQRRLLSPITFKKIQVVSHDLRDLLRSLKGRETWFIDHYGEIFKYIKTTSVRVMSHKIKKIDLRESYCVVHFQGLDVPFIEPRPPAYKYGRILWYKGGPWMVFEYSDKYLKPDNKKV